MKITAALVLCLCLIGYGDAQSDKQPSPLVKKAVLGHRGVDYRLGIQQCRFGGLFGGIGCLRRLYSLLGDNQEGKNNGPCCRPAWPSEKAVPTWAVPCGVAFVFLGVIFVRFSGDSTFVKFGGIVCALLGGALILTGYEECQYNKSEGFTGGYGVTRETRTTIQPGDIQAVEIECTNCHYRIVKPSGGVWPQNIMSCPGGCGAVWMPYRDALKTLHEAVFQVRNFSTLAFPDGKPPFVVRFEISGDEKP